MAMLHGKALLHEIPKPIIEHDIATFLDYKLRNIKDNYNRVAHIEQQLHVDWPGSETLHTLVEMAVPLFIFATTVCRFIEDPTWFDPACQLTKVLEYRSKAQQSEMDKLDATYRPILDQLIVGGSKAAKRSLVDEFKTVVGPIVLLAEPLSISSLARLLEIPKRSIYRRLGSLHSVLSVPDSLEYPVRMFHLSFRDFLVDSSKQKTNPFWINEAETHCRIAIRCQELLDSSGHLKKDICGLEKPGINHSSIDPEAIDLCLPIDIRYACQYWVYHLEQSGARLTDSHQAYIFLKCHFLHLLEALSLLGKLSESVAMIRSLQALITPSRINAKFSAFLYDAYRFILNCRSTVAQFPLQVYSSAIIFAPERSITRKLFENCIPSWISLLPEVDLEWSACLQTLEDHDSIVRAVAFSLDGKTLASSSDNVVRLWDPTTGEQIQELQSPIPHGGIPLGSTFRGGFGFFDSTVFSPDGTMLASFIGQVIQVWDSKTGAALHTFGGHICRIDTMAFSLDNKTLASASTDAIRLWDLTTGKQIQELKISNHQSKIITILNSKTLALLYKYRIVQIWDIETGKEVRKFEWRGDGDNRRITSSINNEMVASVSIDGIWLWNLTTGELLNKFKNYSGRSLKPITISRDSKTLVGISGNQILFWDLTEGKLIHELEDHSRISFDYIALSPDSKLLVSIKPVTDIYFSPTSETVISLSSQSIQFWDPITRMQIHEVCNYHVRHGLLTFLPNSKALVLSSYKESVFLWDLTTNDMRHISKTYEFNISTIAFSLDGKKLALAIGGKLLGANIRLVDLTTGKEIQNLEGHTDTVAHLGFSPDGQTLASASHDHTIRLWDLMTGREIHQLKISYTAVAIAFSPNSKTLTSVTEIYLWNGVQSGLTKNQPKQHRVAFPGDHPGEIPRRRSDFWYGMGDSGRPLISLPVLLSRFRDGYTGRARSSSAMRASWMWQVLSSPRTSQSPPTYSDLLHAHLRRHEKREKQNVRGTGTRPLETSSQRTASKRRGASYIGSKQDNYTTHSSGSAYDPLGRMWPPPIEPSDNPMDHLNTSHNSQSLSSDVLELPQSMANPNSMLQSTDNWGMTPVQGLPMSLNPEMPWPFQDGGIFGLSSGFYSDLPADEYLDPFRDDIGHIEDHGSLTSLEFESDTAQLESTDPMFLGQGQCISPEDYQRLIDEFPGLANDFLGDRQSLFRLCHRGLDYTEICMPFFHQPTLKISLLPPLLILAICSLGARVSDDYHARETGQLIHSHVWRRIFIKAMESRQIDIWTLQTMVLLEHIGFYALSRSAHEKADVFHAMLVTLARRSSFLAQSFEGGSNSRQPLEKRWEEWAERETVIRVAYTIFVHDVDYSIHFMHPSLLSLGMIKLPLPCLPALWQAKSAVEWERQMEQTRQTNRAPSLRTLRGSIELLLPAHCDHSRQRLRGALLVFGSSAFILQVLIHGLASAVFEHKFRGINSGCTLGIQTLKLKEFEEGLQCWYSCFEHRNVVDHGSTEIVRSALITYHFVSILLKESLSDIQMAAGTAYSWGRVVTPQRAQEAFLPLVSTQPVGQEAYRHALNVISLCLDDDEQQERSTEQPKKMLLHPLHLTYNAFIGVLVLWAYALGLSRSQQHRQEHHTQIWVVEGGKLKHLKAKESYDNNDESAGKGDTQELVRILERGFARPVVVIQEIETIRTDVRRLMHIVRNRLDGGAWELSQEARRVLDALLDKNGFME
ncbi:hypothetical protein B7463_g6767, partial [Scytalidium lignicola]